MDIQWYTGINQQYLYVHESTLVFANWTRGIYHNLWRLDSGKMTKKTSRWGLEGTSNSTRFSIVREVCFLWCDMTNCAVLGLDVQVRKSIVHIYIYIYYCCWLQKNSLPWRTPPCRRPGSADIYIYYIYIYWPQFLYVSWQEHVTAAAARNYTKLWVSQMGRWWWFIRIFFLQILPGMMIWITLW